MKLAKNLLHDPKGLSDIYIAAAETDNFDFLYGGIRLVHHHTDEHNINSLLYRLTVYESLLKNTLINSVLENGILNTFSEYLPEGFLNSRLGGARCVIKPKSIDTDLAIHQPGTPDFDYAISEVMKPLGEWLNMQNGRIKLTPDLGKFATIADHLAAYTPHVMAVNEENGGCGWKAPYVTTSIIAAIEALEISPNEPVTLIGSNGATGRLVLKYLLDRKFTEIDICDLSLTSAMQQHDNIAIRWIRAEHNRFPDECLGKNKVIIACTNGQELENSNLEQLRPGTRFFLAHNLAIPAGDIGLGMVRCLLKRNIMLIPGQLLTIGGTFVSRLEWYWRLHKSGEEFNKEMAEALVRKTVTYLINRFVTEAERAGISLFEALCYQLPL